MNHGKQLRLFLPDGTPSGPRYYELVNWTGQALLVPVNRVKELVSGEWPEFEGPGVYCVRGLSEEGHPRLYIGESDGVAKRVQAHPATVGFEVSDILLFASKDGNLTKTHVLWLETQLIQRAVQAKRITITNSKQPALRQLPKPEEATMMEFISNLELVAQTAGFSYFSELKTKTSEKTTGEGALFLKMPQVGLKATAIRTDEGLLVRSGSEASLSAYSTLSKGYASQRDELIDKGALVADGEKLRFSVDTPFASPSAAAAIIAGSPAAGPQMWKDASGKKLGDILKAEQANQENSSDE